MIMKATDESNSRVRRISISLLPDVFEALDHVREERGFRSRSQAISEMINQALTEDGSHLGSEVVSGTITLVYDESKYGLMTELAQIRRANIDEVISSQSILLENDFVYEVYLVQGEACRLKDICDQLTACKGVRQGNLSLTSMIMPPIAGR